MKRENLFTSDLDNDDSVIDREEFVLRRESAALAAKGEKMTDEMLKTIGKGFGKMFLVTLLPFVLLIVGIACAYMAFDAYAETKAFPLALALVALFSLFFAVVAFVFARRYTKKKEALNDQTEKGWSAALDALHEERKQELSVPKDAQKLEVFTVCYSSDPDLATEGVYSNAETEVFREEGKLCFLYSGAVVAIPLDAIDALVKLPDTVTFDGWLKDAAFDGGAYAQYGITKKELDEIEERYTMQGCYSLHFDYDGTPLEILIPLYESEVLLPLIGITPAEE